MKNFFKIILAMVVCFGAMFGLVACKEPELSATSNSTTGVVSNGGSVVSYNNYIYFINGTKTNDGTGNKTGKVVQSAIYKAKLDDNGDVLEMTQVVSSLVGFSNGSIHIFGDFLYYATPNNGKNSKGETLYYQTCFYRYDLVTGASQLLYTTIQNSTDETIDYTYYKFGEKLYLLVYEKSQKTITSIEINNKTNKKVIVNDAESVLFGENFGEVRNAENNSIAENYVFFTRSALETGTVRTGVRVYKIYPDGSGEIKISEGESVSLLTTRNDKLVYSLNSNIYMQSITAGQDTLTFNNNQIISLESYENVIFLEEDDGGVGLLVFENNIIRYLKLNNGVVPETDTINNRVVYAFDGDDVKATFVATEGDYVVYMSSNLLYKVKYKNIGENEIIAPEKLSTTTANEADGMLTAEILNGYIYFFNKTDNSTYMYRASMTTPSINDVDDDGNRKVVGAATLFGVKE